MSTETEEKKNDLNTQISDALQYFYDRGQQDLLDNLQRMLGMPSRPTNPWPVKDFVTDRVAAERERVLNTIWDSLWDDTRETPKEWEALQGLRQRVQVVIDDLRKAGTP